MSYYPQKISKRFQSPEHSGDAGAGSVAGTEVDLMCGVSLKISLCIDQASKTITAARFRTSGCGFVIAAADLLAEIVTGKKLTGLHGLEDL
ncbi:MAG: iron-sulfur cluster assembly scaffold protein, partial [Acidobacteria bacterium]|nr:iron-sulfur cluster assembly scaffold protein [Acidobacteriota bacterium]